MKEYENKLIDDIEHVCRHSDFYPDYYVPKLKKLRSRDQALLIIEKKEVYTLALFQCFRERDDDDGLDWYNINFTPSLEKDEYLFLKENLQWQREKI